MQQFLIITVIGLVAMALLVYLFSLLGKQEVSNDPRRVEELWVHAHGDSAMVKLYYKAHSDEERAQIVHFIHSTCPDEPGPGEESMASTPKLGKKTARRQQATQSFAAKLWGAKGTTDSAPSQETDQLLAVLEEEDELDEAILTRQERKALRKKEKEEKAAAKEAARQQAIADAKKVKLSQGLDGQQEEYPDLEAALAAAISKAENQSPLAPTSSSAPDSQADTDQATLVLERDSVNAALYSGSSFSTDAASFPSSGSAMRETPEQILSKILAESDTTTPTVTESTPEAAAPAPALSLDAEPLPSAKPAEPKQATASVCPHCGAETLPGCKFCIVCGLPLAADGDLEEKTAPVPEAAAPAPALSLDAEPLPSAKPAEPKQATASVCPHCGTEILSGCKFCIVCGLPLAADGDLEEKTAPVPEAAAPAPALSLDAEPLPSAKPAEPKQATASVCPHCGTETLPGCKFCIVCGLPLAADGDLEEKTAPVPEAAAPAPALSLDAEPLPSAKPAEPKQATASVCPHCGAQVSLGCRFCVICGKTVDQAPEPDEAPETPAPTAPLTEPDEAPETPAPTAPLTEPDEAPETPAPTAPLTEPDEAPETPAPTAPLTEPDEAPETPAPTAPLTEPDEAPETPAPTAPLTEPDEAPETPAPTAPLTEPVEAGSYWDPFADRSQMRRPQTEPRDAEAETLDLTTSPQKEEAQIASSLNALDKELKAVQATIEAWTAQVQADQESRDDLTENVNVETEPVEEPTAPAGSYWDPFADRSQMIANQKAEQNHQDADGSGSATQPHVQGKDKDLSATLGLPQTLSLEEILRNVRELEKRITKESETPDHEE